MKIAATASLLVSLLSISVSGAEAAGVSHHGGPILHCEPPTFFDETPPRDSKATRFQDFSITASDNTDAGTVKVWVNNEPVAPTITEERSGRLAIQGRLPTPLTQGKAWIRVTADSKDGCDQLFVWNVYLP
jgi:hypothetical protein